MFSSILVKLGKNVCLYDILDVFKNGLSGVKKLGQKEKSEKKFVYALEAKFFSSPEREVLRVSSCDSPVSVVQCQLFAFGTL